MVRLHNLIEPLSLVEAFLAEPPEGFKAVRVGAGEGFIPAFLTKFDLATAADKDAKKWLERLRFFIPKPRTLFAGTTVSEYALFPEGASADAVKGFLLKELKRQRAQFLIIKDIPSASPLIDESSNAFSGELMACLEKSGFFMLQGQALAYVPVDFSSTEEYLQRFSKSRRKDFKRKLRSFADVTVEAVPTGSGFFDAGRIREFYGLFVNVYEKSYIHFDKLTEDFFARVLADKKSGGVAFIYRHGEKILGFNLCFKKGDMLIDKYVGFVYPDAQEHNIYFLSWFYNLEYCVKEGLKTFVAGWTDPEIKAYLGAKFTHTHHAVYIKNPALRFVLGKFKGAFEADKKVIESLKAEEEGKVRS